MFSNNMHIYAKIYVVPYIVQFMKYEFLLVDIGLDKKEAKLYLSALPLGSVSVLKLSYAVGMHRPALYRLLTGLVNKGVFKVTFKKSRKLYMAVDPHELLDLMEQRRQRLNDALPELAALAAFNKEKAKVLYFQGRQQLLGLYKTGLEAEQKHIRSFFPSKYMIEVFGKAAMEEIIAERVARGIFAQTLRAPSSEAVFEGSHRTAGAFREVRYLPSNKVLVMGVVIFDDTVNLFAPVGENFGMQIQSRSYADLMKCFFDALWQISSNEPS
jgi:sugar-specific transcriptional regulator TrmB